MLERLEGLARFVRANVAGIVAAVVLAALASAAVRWIVKNGEKPAPRKVMQFTMVNVDRPPSPKPPPPPPTPPPPQQQPKVEEKTDEPQQPNRVELKPQDLPPPDAPPPPPGGGRLGMDSDGAEGPGDAFNLVGSRGGKGLLNGPGGLGDGSGSGVGEGSAQARWAWYYTRVQGDLEAVLRRSKKLSASSLVMEIRVSWDESGRVTLVQPVKSSGDPALDREYEALVGHTLRNPPPADVPKPVVFRIRARRPQ
jgi:TonB family protein